MADYPTLGILTGISFQSGVDYYRGVNEEFQQHVRKKHVIKPNPNLTMVSIDCDLYVQLIDGEWSLAQ